MAVLGGVRAYKRPFLPELISHQAFPAHHQVQDLPEGDDEVHQQDGPEG